MNKHTITSGQVAATKLKEKIFQHKRKKKKRNPGGFAPAIKRKSKIMKTLNHLLLTAAAVLTVSGALATQAGEPSTLAKITKNTPLLTSPRYLEVHPEILR